MRCMESAQLTALRQHPMRCMESAQLTALRQHPNYEVYGVTVDSIEIIPNEVHEISTSDIETTPNEVYGVRTEIMTTLNEVSAVSADSEGIETTHNYN